LANKGQEKVDSGQLHKGTVRTVLHSASQLLYILILARQVCEVVASCKQLSVEALAKAVQQNTENIFFPNK
jgi:hypothetical protein